MCVFYLFAIIPCVVDILFCCIILGLRQCLVQLSTLPVAVLHGSGQNIYDAHAHAAHNALQYLKLMIKS